MNNAEVRVLRNDILAFRDQYKQMVDAGLVFVEQGIMHYSELIVKNATILLDALDADPRSIKRSFEEMQRTEPLRSQIELFAHYLSGHTACYLSPIMDEDGGVHVRNYASLSPAEKEQEKQRYRDTAKHYSIINWSRYVSDSTVQVNVANVQLYSYEIMVEMLIALRANTLPYQSIELNFKQYVKDYMKERNGVKRSNSSAYIRAYEERRRDGRNSAYIAAFSSRYP